MERFAATVALEKLWLRTRNEAHQHHFGSSPWSNRVARSSSQSGVSGIMVRTSSVVTSALLTVPTSFPWGITPMRSDRSKTSWMSWLMRKIPLAYRVVSAGHKM